MKSTRHLVDPQLLEALDAAPTQQCNAETLQQLRTNIGEDIAATELDAAARAVEVVTRPVPGPKGAPEVQLLIFRPARPSASLGCIYHIHGGGYICGSATMMTPLHRRMVAGLGCVIVTVEYRLAPETVFPGAIEDCYAGLSWLFRHAAELNVDPRRIGVKGESAGGGLAAALALLARDRGELELAFQHLIYPMIDDRTCVDPDPHPFAGEYGWTADSNRFGWSSLLGVSPGSQNVSPFAAVSRALDVSRLPPTFMATAALDLFVEENIEYARRLIRAGVPCELHVYPGAYHGFDYDPKAEVARTARRDSMAALARFLERTPAG